MMVAPLAGARIEIIETYDEGSTKTVAPLAGARIEIYGWQHSILPKTVAPLAGARIEITYRAYISTYSYYTAQWRKAFPKR